MSKLDWERVGALAKKALAGDKLAYSEFLTTVSVFLRPRIARSLPSVAVEDALQETLMAIHKSLHTLDVDRSVMSWVCAIAHYKIQDQLRAIYKNALLEEFDEASFAKEELALDQETSLNDLLKGLGPKEVSILKFLKVEGLSVAETAKEMNMSESNVKVTAFRAIRKLRESLAREDFYENG